MNTLFDTVKVGDYTLKNRFVMAPMTRARADAAGIQPPIAVTYYRQRATAGLIITEGTPPDPLGKGYTRIPGIYSEAQVESWKPITDAVHEEGSRIFLQFMHTGRIAHEDNLNGETPVSSSPVKAAGQMFTKTGPKDHPTPRELTADEVIAVIEAHKKATENALRAGFDGVELHATSGYLPSQFLHSNTNLRTDEWGGSLEKRTRFILETLDAMISVAGNGKVGIKIGPGFPFNDIDAADAQETYTYLVTELAKRNLAYLDVLDIHPGWDVLGTLRPLYPGTLIANGGYTKERSATDLNNGRADLIAFGTAFLATPDLPERFAQDAPLNEPDKATFYMGEEKGYIDYPTL